MSKAQEKLNVVIVGGGQGGVQLARALVPKLDKSKYDLILIDKRPVLVHLLATARLAVTSQNGLDKDALLPYDRVFSTGYGEYIQGKVTAIEKTTGTTGGHVVLEKGDRIPFAVLVLATGSVWDGTTNYPDSLEEIHEFVTDNQTRIKNSKNAVIVGAGAVGLELAGEIRDEYPEKSITVVQGGEMVLNDAYAPKFRKSVQDSFERRGIKFVLKDYIDEPLAPGATSITTRHGKSIDADVVLFARGPKPNTEFIVKSLGGDSVDTRGFVKVKRTLQLVSHAEIFALGDITDIPEQKMSAKAGLHAGVLTQNVVAYLDKQPLKEYLGMMEAIAITNGKNGGRIWVPLLWGIILGDWFAWLAKARTLFVPKYKKLMGY